MRRSISFLVLVALVATACHRTLEEAGGEVMLRDHVADVEVHSTTGDLLGTLRFAHNPNGSARLVGQLTGLATGKHAIHVHDVGACDGPTFASAGKHFNPMGKQHGLENPLGSHAGDAPAIESDATLQSLVDVTFAHATLNNHGLPNGLFDANGSAVVIHAGNDDQKTDPAGMAGSPVACGVVKRR